MLFVLPCFARSGTRRACRKVRALESGSPFASTQGSRDKDRPEVHTAPVGVSDLSGMRSDFGLSSDPLCCCCSNKERLRCEPLLWFRGSMHRVRACVAATNVTRPQVLWFWWGNGHENRFQSFSARFNARSAGGIALLKNRTGKAMPSFKIWFLISHLPD